MYDADTLARRRIAAARKAKIAGRRHVVWVTVKSLLLAMMLYSAVMHIIHPDLIACSLGVWALLPGEL